MGHINNTTNPPGDRVDGKLKVTGAATYAAEYKIDKLLHGVLVGSTIAKGSIRSMDITAAKKAPGVLDIITHENSLKIDNLADEKKAKDEGYGLRIFHTKEIFSNGQPVALVVADKLQQAQYAASLIKVSYDIQQHVTDFDASLANIKSTGEPDKPRGDKDAWKSAAVQVQQEYTIPSEMHSPMEMHATIAVWDGDNKLTIYDKNHAVKDIQKTVAGIFKLEEKNVSVIAEYIGGGFGSGLRVWPHTIAAIIAAKKLQRPVKVSLSRPQMFTMAGYRPHSWQKVSIGADADGSFKGILHEAVSQTSMYENFGEGITGISKALYHFPNLQSAYKTLPLNVATPIWMRAPGEATGSFGLESAIDELSYKLKMDPLALRIKNYADKNPDDGLPWSSNYLKECYETASKKFGWEKRKPLPRASREGDWWTGVGMGVGTWGAWRAPSTARGKLDSTGHLLLQSATSDMGPGTATAMVDIAAAALSIPREKISFQLGKSSYPDAPGQGGSITTASVGSAVYDVCTDIKKKLAEMAASLDNSGFKGAKFEDLVFADGNISLKKNASVNMTYEQLILAKKMDEVDVTTASSSPESNGKFSFASWAVHFAEVQVHAYTGIVRVKRFVSCVDAGKIVNEKTAASQIRGAVVWGIGMALMEEQEMDHRSGRQIGNDFAGYHIPVNADVPVIDVSFVNKPDPNLNAMGSKGLGEVGLIGSAAAIANAVYHATGKRITNLPINCAKLVE